MNHDEARTTAGPAGGRTPMCRQLEATLAYDSRERATVAGVRAVALGLPRLVYRAAGYEVDLQVRPGSRADRIRVLGQVLDEGFEPCSGWVVVEAERGFVKTGLDGCGHFSIDGLTTGPHRVEVSLADACIVLPPVHF